MDLSWIKKEPETSEYSEQDQEIEQCCPEPASSAAAVCQPPHITVAAAPHSTKENLCCCPLLGHNTLTDLVEIEEFDLNKIKEEEIENPCPKQLREETGEHVELRKNLTRNAEDEDFYSNRCSYILRYSHIFHNQKMFSRCGPIRLVECPVCCISFKNRSNRLILLLHHVFRNHFENRHKLTEDIMEKYDALVNNMIEKIIFKCKRM